jgi:hypothetical protein
MKAEPGKFGLEGQAVGGPGQEGSPFPLDGSQIIVGVVAMHNMIIAMARAIKASNKTLMHLQAAVGEDSKVHDLPVDQGYLETIINENLDIISSINLEEPK